MIFKLWKKWKNQRKIEMYISDPADFFKKQNDAIKAMSVLEWYKMLKDFHFTEWERAVEYIKNSKPGENIEKQKAIIEYSEKLINFLESREN